MEKIPREDKVVLVTAKSWPAFQKLDDVEQKRIYKYSRRLAYEIKGVSLAGAMDILWGLGRFLYKNKVERGMLE